MYFQRSGQHLQTKDKGHLEWEWVPALESSTAVEVVVVVGRR